MHRICGQMTLVVTLAVVLAGCAAQEFKRFIHVELAAFGDDPFGLLDQNASVERGLELFGDDLTLSDGPSLQQPDRGDVRECLRESDNDLVELARFGAEQAERAGRATDHAAGPRALFPGPGRTRRA